MFKICCEKLEKLTNPNVSSLLIRIALGLVFINAGWNKINNIESVIGFFGQLGFNEFLAYCVAYTEFIGGILVLLGGLTRIAGGLLAVIMLVASIFVHGSKGYSQANGGFEYTLTLFLVLVALITLGAGKYSLDNFCNCSKFCKKK